MNRKTEGIEYKKMIESAIKKYRENNENISVEYGLISNYDPLHAGGTPLVEGDVSFKNGQDFDSGYAFEIDSLTKNLNVTTIQIQENGKASDLEIICDLNNSIGKRINRQGIYYQNLSENMKKDFLSLGDNYIEFKENEVLQVVV